MPLLHLLNKGISTIKSGLYYFVFAPECLECHAVLLPHERCFCQGCATLFEIVEAQKRCEKCFKELENLNGRSCSECQRKFHEFAEVASACEYLGPPATMIRLMKYGNRPDLASIAAAYMAVQWSSIDWPKPDFIVPVPSTWLRKFDRGYNQAELLATELGKLMGVPVAKNLKRRIGDLSQAGLGREQRLAQPLKSFYARDKKRFEDKILLLVDDVMTTGKTVNACAEALNECFPKEIYALTFCRAVAG